MVVTKFSRQKLVRFWAFRLRHPYQSHYSFMWDILPWICFSRTYLVITPLSPFFSFPFFFFFFFFFFLWTHITSFKPKKQYFYPSRRVSGALFIIMICMGVQEISVGCLDLWYGYDWWNGTCFHSQFVSSIVDVILVKKKKKRKKKKKWWRKLFLMLQTVHVHNSS